MRILRSLDAVLAAIPHSGVKGVQRNMRLLEKGFDQLLRSVVFRGTDLSDVLDLFWRSFQAIEMSEKMVALEADEAMRTSGKSIYPPWSKRRITAESFGTNDKTEPSYLGEAIDFLVAQFGGQKFRRMGLDGVYERAPKTTNWGLPHMSSDKSVHPSYLRRARSLRAASDIYPAVGGTRVTASKPEAGKLPRLFWQVDHSEVVYTLTFFYPIMDAMKSVPRWCGFAGPLKVDEVIINGLSTYDTCISADYSAWDSTVPGWMLHAVCEAIGMLFPGQAKAANLMAEIWLEMDLILPDGEYGGRASGLPSGIGGTLGANSMAHTMLSFMLQRELGAQFKWDVQFGDDAIYATDAPIEEVAGAAAIFGFEMSDDKSDSSSGSVHYLQNLHELGWSGGKGRRSVNRTLLSMLCYERPRPKWWRGEHDTMRYVMQLEETKNHEVFRPLVEFWYEHDEIMQQLPPMELFRVGGGAEVAKRIQGPTEYHRSDPSGFAQFEVVKIWEELRG